MNIASYIRSGLLALPFFLSFSATTAQDLKFILMPLEGTDTTGCARPEVGDVRGDISLSQPSTFMPVKKAIVKGESFGIIGGDDNLFLPEHYKYGIKDYLHTDSLMLEGLELQAIGRKKGENDTVGLSLDFLFISNTQECKESVSQDIESIKKWIQEQYMNLYDLFLTIYPSHQNNYNKINLLTLQITVTLQISEEGVKVIVNY